MERIERIEIWHILWNDGEKTNRLSIRYNKDHEIISLGIIHGRHLPVYYLENILDRAIPDWKERAETLHLSRVNPWIVEKHTSYYGSTNYILRYLKDPVYFDTPIGAVLHVSCANKIGSFSMWLGDLAPIIAQLKKDYKQEEADIREIIEVNIYKDFRDPGTPSGILNT